MEIKIDIIGDDVELTAFLHNIMKILARKKKRPLKRKIRRN